MSLIAQARTEIRRQLRNSRNLNIWLAPEHAEALLECPKKPRKRK